MSDPFFRNSRQLAAGELLRDRMNARVYKAPMLIPNAYPKLDRPPRPCAKCGQRFQPTERRRMRCCSCFANAERRGEW